MCVSEVRKVPERHTPFKLVLPLFISPGARGLRGESSRAAFGDKRRTNHRRQILSRGGN